jgi:hypothetical protein
LLAAAVMTAGMTPDNLLGLGLAVLEEFLIT